MKALYTGEFHTSLNHTFITLISKKKSPVNVADFRPINLCNVIYQLITKVIANRLKRVLPSIISKSQSAFVPSCPIADNVLVVYELIHYLKQKKVRKK